VRKPSDKLQKGLILAVARYSARPLLQPGTPGNRPENQIGGTEIWYFRFAGVTACAAARYSESCDTEANS
jgi:hypothetical protein